MKKTNKILILTVIIVAMVFLLVIYFEPQCSYLENIIREKIDEINYCSSDNDCTNVGIVACGFGCYQFVNNNETNKIQEIKDLSETYFNLCPESRCIRDLCLNVEPVCINNKCVASE